MRILIVDDSLLMRDSMGDLLKEHGRCDNAPNGEIAAMLLKVALESGVPYDLVTMDIEMPGLSGQQTVAKLRQTEASLGIKGDREVKILMSTSRNEMEMVSFSYYEGCNGYINKPPTQEKITKALKDLYKK